MSLLTDVFHAYYCARRNKRNTYSQVAFERNAAENLIALTEEISSRRYQPGRSICFIVTNPVKREVFAAQFRDRIVHHLLFNYLSPICEQIFIKDSYSCRKEKGTLYGVIRLQEQMKECMTQTMFTCYVLKCDIKGYFMHINKNVLYGLVKKIVENASGLDKELIMFLLDKVIFNDPTVDCIMRAKSSEWDDLPKSKSLFYSPKGSGLPIGNLTSQLFSNIYLNELDIYVKNSLGFDYYGRYVDDFYIISDSKEKLLRALPQLRRYLKERLSLELHPKKIYIQECRKGVKFLGAVCYPDHRRMSASSSHKMKCHINDTIVSESNPWRLLSVMQSYSGYKYNYNKTLQ